MTTRQRAFAALCRLLQAPHCQSTSSTQLPNSVLGLGLGQSSAASQASSCRSNGLLRQARQHLQFKRGFATQPDKQSTAEAAVQQASRAAAAGTARATAQNAGARVGAGAAAGARAGAAPGARAGGGAAAGANSAPPPPPLSGFEQWWRAFQRVPPVPKWLALSGVIPFIGLAPPVAKHLEPLLPTLIYENCDLAQLIYGVIIVTFLGAVHWGVALATPLTSHVAYKMANSAYVYSVLPSLVAWPVATMEPGIGHLCLTTLLVGVYLADLSRKNYFPTWYIALRLPVTVMACFGTLLTFTRHYYVEMEKVEKFKQAEEQAAAAQAQAAA